MRRSFVCTFAADLAKLDEAAESLAEVSPRSRICCGALLLLSPAHTFVLFSLIRCLCLRRWCFHDGSVHSSVDSADLARRAASAQAQPFGTGGPRASLGPSAVSSDYRKQGSAQGAQGACGPHGSTEGIDCSSTESRGDESQSLLCARVDTFSSHRVFSLTLFVFVVCSLSSSFAWKKKRRWTCTRASSTWSPRQLK